MGCGGSKPQDNSPPHGPQQRPRSPGVKKDQKSVKQPSGANKGGPGKEPSKNSAVVKVKTSSKVEATKSKTESKVGEKHADPPAPKRVPTGKVEPPAGRATGTAPAATTGDSIASQHGSKLGSTLSSSTTSSKGSVINKVKTSNVVSALSDGGSSALKSNVKGSTVGEHAAVSKAGGSKVGSVPSPVADEVEYVKLMSELSKPAHSAGFKVPPRADESVYLGSAADAKSNADNK